MKESEILEMFRLGIKYMDITDYQDAYIDIMDANTWKPCKLSKHGRDSIILVCRVFQMKWRATPIVI